MKKCHTCSETNLSQFCRDKNSPDGLSYYCKECNKTRKHEWYEKNKGRVDEQSRLWRKEYPGGSKAISARSYIKNRDKILERRIAYNREHPELVKRQKQEYASKNRERVLKSKHRWAKAHPELVRAYHLANEQKRRARRIRATIGNVAAIRKFYVYVHTSSLINCHYCNCPIPLGKREVEHKIPLSRGGEHSLYNLTASCPVCNRKKYIKTADEFSLKKNHAEFRS